jgi:F0F1-type ATP synthase assembly protein I
LLGAGAVGFLTLGVAVAVSLALGWAIGYLVDGWAGTAPVFTLLGLAFGIVVATLMTVNRVRKYL